ncbi:MAG: ATP-dependent Clp protease adaptor ClpS [Verrucomicrobiota bacterium]
MKTELLHCAVSVPKGAGPLVAPSPAQPKTQVQIQPELEPPYHVILHDDDMHTYAYVVEMLAAIFGYEMTMAFKMACEVDNSGRVIVATCHKELAELRVEQIESYGADPRMKESNRSMYATMEAAE